MRQTDLKQTDLKQTDLKQTDLRQTDPFRNRERSRKQPGTPQHMRRRKRINCSEFVLDTSNFYAIILLYVWLSI